MVLRLPEKDRYRSLSADLNIYLRIVRVLQWFVQPVRWYPLSVAHREFQNPRQWHQKD